MYTSNKTQERIGELFILAQLILYGLFPVLSNYTTKQMPPILFAGASTLVSSIALFLYLFAKKELRFIFNKKAFIYILGVMTFIVVLPSIFIFIGTSKTSGTNTAILLQTEVLFTFIAAGLFFKEKITLRKIIGASAIVMGAIMVLYNGSFDFNSGDLFIIAGTVFYPFGNKCAKKALAFATPSIVLFLRSLMGGTFLVLVSLIFEKYTLHPAEYIEQNLVFILLTGLLIYFLSKLLWYEGLKRLDISKAISLGMAFPVFSLIYAFLFLHEIPTSYQLGGLIIIIVGLYILIKQKITKIIIET